MVIHISDLETKLLQSLIAKGAPKTARPIFILGAPRTGSTIVYQALAGFFRLPFFANLTNMYYPDAPIIGLSIQAAHSVHDELLYSSRYGKVPGIFQPSEASAVMAHWFGGGHPSQATSNNIVSGKKAHFLTTLAASESLFEKPLVIKNAWNCFRIKCLNRALPGAIFVWIRRDIAASAKSDLHARYIVQGSPEAWNSATPSNVEELRRKPYWVQVVENQYEFSQAISRAAQGLANGRLIEIWYEDFCIDPVGTLTRIGKDCLPLRDIGGQIPPNFTIHLPRRTTQLSDTDISAVGGFISENDSRFADLRYRNSKGAP